jgi:predicted RNase H-like nuclease
LIGRFLGVDLAWRESRADLAANETGVAVLDANGKVLDAGWAHGLDETVASVLSAAGDEPALLFVDAPLVVDNPAGQRSCETQVGRRYGAWHVSANSTNTASPRMAGVALRKRLQHERWRYDDGLSGPPTTGQSFSECYPYTTLVGAVEFGYDIERPRYKRKPRQVPAQQWRPQRAATCDQLISRMGRLDTADPPLHIDSHPLTKALLDEPSPINDRAYKHREDLIDALLCAWTAAFWARHGHSRCQVLSGAPVTEDQPYASIIAPARPEQRR